MCNCRSDRSDRQPRHRFLEPIHNVKEGANPPHPPANRRNSDLHLWKFFAATSAKAGGGASRDRTDDLKLAKLALSQLSYGPMTDRNRGVFHFVHVVNSVALQWWAEKELNLRPHAYQACALTT